MPATTQKPRIKNSLFRSQIPELQTLYEEKPGKVDEFRDLLEGETIIYIDFANIKPWHRKLEWHFDPERMKQFFDSIDSIKRVRFYYGTISGSKKSGKFIKDLKKAKYEVTTKPIKEMRLSINASSIPDDSPELLKTFIRYPLLEKFSMEEVKYLNGLLYGLNTRGIHRITDWKCNFDVEIGRDMMRDFLTTKTETFILFGGDSDFESPIRQLLSDGKRVILVATARKIASELNTIRKDGLHIFEVKKLKEFFCKKEEIVL